MSENLSSLKKAQKRNLSSDEDEKSQTEDNEFKSPYYFRPRKKPKETTENFLDSPLESPQKGKLILTLSN